MPKWEKGVTVIAGGGATRQAPAGSRSSEADVELLLVDVGVEEVRKTTVVAGSGFTRKAIVASQSTETEVISLGWKRGRRKNEGTDETVAEWHGRNKPAQ